MAAEVSSKANPRVAFMRCCTDSSAGPKACKIHKVRAEAGKLPAHKVPTTRQGTMRWRAMFRVPVPLVKAANSSTDSMTSVSAVTSFCKIDGDRKKQSAPNSAAGDVAREEVYEVVLAGNATMTQLALGIDPELQLMHKEGRPVPIVESGTALTRLFS